MTGRLHLPSWPGARAAALQDRVSRAREQLEAQRPSNPIVAAVLGSAQLLSEAGGGLLAGAIAFRFFLFLVPGVFVLVMGLGLGADLSGSDPRGAARTAGIAGLAATAITSSSSSSTATQWVTFGLALFALAVGARNLVKALWVAHALIWQVPRRKPRHTGRAAAALFVGVVLELLAVRLADALRGVSLPAWVLALALSALVPAGLWLAASRTLLPVQPGAGWRQVLPGAVLFGVGVQALHVVTVVWITASFESKSQAYGAIGAALSILLWAYLLGLVVTAAAALNATLWRAGHPDPEPGA